MAEAVPLVDAWAALLADSRAIHDRLLADNQQLDAAIRAGTARQWIADQAAALRPPAEAEADDGVVAHPSLE